MNLNKKHKISSNRSFGLVFFAVFLIVALWPLKNEEDIRLWSLVLSIIFLILGILNSKLLTPLNKLWLKFGIFLGRKVTPIVMGIIFFLTVTPTGIIMRLFNRDFFNKKIKKSSKSYWIKRKEPIRSMKNQFQNLQMSFIKEFLMFLKVRKKFWLLPILIMLVLFGGLIVLSQGSAVAPFIYTLF